MGNLFSTFDPNIGIVNLNFNWVSAARIAFLPSGFWVIRRKIFLALKTAFLALAHEIKLVNYKGAPNSLWLGLRGLLLFILTNNFLGLVPYIFTASRHLSFTLALRVSSWAGYIVYSSVKNPSRFLAHLVPNGTPKVLIPFIVIIELIRSLIRPITLGVRLAANIVAGHLLLVLVRCNAPFFSYFILRLAFRGLLVLIVLEVAVSFIQSYVFISLSSLYIREIHSGNL